MRAAVARALGALEDFAFPRVDPYLVGVYRILLGLFLLAYHLMLVPNFLEYYSPHGFAYQPALEWSQWSLRHHSLLHYIHGDLALRAFEAACVGASLLLVLGWAGRWPAVWLWVANFSIMYRCVEAGATEEQVLGHALLFTMFMPLDRALRVPAPWDPPGAREPPPEDVEGWAVRALQVHVLFVYLFSCPAKLIEDETWIEGTAIYYAVHSLLFSTWPDITLFDHGGAFLSRVLTRGSYALELVYPALVWVPRLRLPLTLAILGMHLGIGFFLNSLKMFNLAMVVVLVLHLPGRRVRGGVEGLRAWWGRGR